MFDELFNKEVSDAKPEKKPTIRQYVKVNKKSRGGHRHAVSLIWLPGKFDNYTLQTERFRVIVSPNHTLFDSLKQFTDKASAERVRQGITIQVENWEAASYLLVPDLRNGYWTAIGESGLRYAFD